MKLTTEQTLQQGIALHNEGKLEGAELFYREILKDYPKHPEANHNLGSIALHHNKPKDALLLFKIATEINPNTEKFWISLANAHFSLNQFEEAKAGYKRVIELNPGNAQAQNNLGAMLQRLNRLEEAEVSYKKAIKIKPDYAGAHYNLSVILQEFGRLNEAIESYRKTIEIKPDYPEAYNNLGTALNELGKFEEAEINFRKAIELKPSFSDALLNRGFILSKKGQYESALKNFDASKTEKGKSRALDTLYSLGRNEEIFQRIEAESILGDKDLRLAAFSSFIATKEKRETKNNFCKNPIDFIYRSNLTSHLKDSNSYINELIEELRNIDIYWQPFGKGTKKGFQSIRDIFENPSKTLDSLKSIIMNELDLYYSKFKDNDCSFIKKWPSKKKIQGWHVILKQQGYQNAHIHPGGWLSGVIYLKVVPSLDKNEGAIEFSLNGENYFDSDSPSRIYKPKIGDIVLFPSSLHHKTIPFTTNEDRIIVSFDLGPQLEN